MSFRAQYGNGDKGKR